MGGCLGALSWVKTLPGMGRRCVRAKPARSFFASHAPALPARMPAFACSKAAGCLGGFVACSRRWKDFLVNRGRSQVYSTALPVPVVAAALAALKVAAEVSHCALCALLR